MTKVTKMSEKIAILSCTKTKKNEPCKAIEMYSLSDYFTSMENYAKEVIECDRILILSARYGLLDPESIIEPYERSLYDYTQSELEEWALRVASDLPPLENAEVISLCGKRYMKEIKPYIEKEAISYERLFEGVRMNSQIKQMNEEIDNA